MNKLSKSSKTLVDYLQQVPDFRRAEGRRYPLASLLVMMIMAIMSRCYAYREIARFMRGNQSELVDLLGLDRDDMPSHVTIRTVLMHLDFESLNGAFRQWVVDHLHLESGSFVAIDAKAIASTVSDDDNGYQDFVCLVSAFAQQQGTVVATQSYHNKQTSEITVTQELINTMIDTLGLRGVTFTFDALHCQKKHSK